MRKAAGRDSGHVAVTFIVDPSVGASAACVCGDFNGWATMENDMKPTEDGGFMLAIELPAGQRFAFRYLVDGERWVNDSAADAYVPNPYGGHNSVVDTSTIDS